MSEPNAAPDSNDAHPTMYLHIGTMKSGTSYVQGVLGRSLPRLEELGILYLNTTDPPGRAVRVALDMDPPKREAATAWDDLANRAKSWTGRAAVFSHEFLSFADADEAKKIVESFAPIRVVVIIAGRDLARQLPSAWQNKIKHGRGWAFQSFVNSAMKEPPEPNSPGRSFWHHHDLFKITRRWVVAAGVDNVRVVTVPAPGADPELLWRRFAEAIDIPPEGFDTTQDQSSNLSLGWLETELVRKVNRLVRVTLDRDQQRVVVQRYFANEVLRPTPETASQRVRPRLSRTSYEWSIERSRQMIEEVKTLDVQVIGDLDDLVPPPEPPSDGSTLADHPPDIPDPVVRAVAALLIKIAGAEVDPTDPRHARRGKFRRVDAPDDAPGDAPAGEPDLDAELDSALDEEPDEIDTPEQRRRVRSREDLD